MRSVDEIRTNEGCFGMKDACENALHRLAPGIIISVSGIPGEMRIAEVVLLHRFQNLQLIDGQLLIERSKARRKALFAGIDERENLRRDVPFFGKILFV